MVEIARALCENAAISPHGRTDRFSHRSGDRNSLRENFRSEKSRRAIVYISHRLEEIHRICDRVTVLRDGGRGSQGPVSEVTREALPAARRARPPRACSHDDSRGEHRRNLAVSESRFPGCAGRMAAAGQAVAAPRPDPGRSLGARGSPLLARTAGRSPAAAARVRSDPTRRRYCATRTPRSTSPRRPRAWPRGLLRRPRLPIVIGPPASPPPTARRSRRAGPSGSTARPPTPARDEVLVELCARAARLLVPRSRTRSSRRTWARRPDCAIRQRAAPGTGAGRGDGRGGALEAARVLRQEGRGPARAPDRTSGSTRCAEAISSASTRLLCAEGERLELTHRASSRQTFVAARCELFGFLVGRPPACTKCADVLGLR